MTDVEREVVWSFLCSVFWHPRPRIVFLEKKLPGWAIFWREVARSSCYWRLVAANWLASPHHAPKPQQSMLLLQKMTATREAFGLELEQLGKENPRIAVLDADLRSSTKTGAFAKAHPDRAVNVGIAEQNLVATAAGFAIAGMRPFACTFAAFLVGRAYDQIRTSVAVSHLPVVLAGSHAGILTGEDGATHQTLEDVGMMRALPGMRVFVPADAAQTRYYTRLAANDDSGPIYLRLGRASVEAIFSSDYDFHPTRVQQLRDGADGVLFACGPLLAPSLRAAAMLEQENGTKLRVINVPCLSPLDSDGIAKALSDMPFAITAEDHSVYNGLGSAVAEVIAENNIGVPLIRHGMRSFGQSGTSEDLYEKFGFDAAGVANVCLGALGKDVEKQKK